MPQSFNISSEDEPEMLTEEEMMTARGNVGSNPPTARGQKTINYSVNIGSMSAEELEFQLFLRGVDVEHLPARIKGKGVGKTRKSAYQEIANDLIRSGRWQTRREEQLLRSRIEEYRSKGASGSI